MLFSSRHLLEIRGRLVAITLEQWLLLAMGMIARCVVWVLFNRRIFHRITGRLKKTFKANAIAAVAGIIGGTVFWSMPGLSIWQHGLPVFPVFIFRGWPVGE